MTNSCSPYQTQCIDTALLPDVISRIAEEVIQEYGKGKVADYIPALKEVNPRQFGMALRTINGEEFCVGQADTLFSIQSISKLFTLMLAMEIVGENLWKRVGREPSGMRFNSLLLLESEGGIPRNPFINAGALVISNVITSHSSTPVKRIEDYIASRSGNIDNRSDPIVAAGEKSTGFVNASIAYLLKAMGNLEGNVDKTLDCYFRQCAISMSCLDLVRATECLANRGESSFQLGPQKKIAYRRINSLMLMCGLYDAVGNFAYNVGLPAKSGVGGGIVAVAPGQYTVSVWSPELDKYGNSVLGQLALEKLTSYTKTSIF
jgi:glutaminase